MKLLVRLSAFVLLMTGFLGVNSAQASGDHAPEKSKTAAKGAPQKEAPKKEHKDGEGEGHEEGEGHSDEGEKPAAESNDSVGPDKGIVAADEHQGFKLSDEAFKNFEIKSIKLENAAGWLIPSSSIVRSGNEVNLFRFRNGFFKRVDFKEVRKTGGQVEITSPDLRAGDGIVTGGLGFLRIVELSAFGGLSESHSH